MKHTALLIVVVAVAILVLGVYYGYIPSSLKVNQAIAPADQNGEDGGNDVPATAELQPFSNQEIHTALCYLTGKALPWLQTNAFIDSLHIEIYGKNAVSYLDMETFYNNLWTADGYTVYVRGYAYHTGYTTYSAMFTKGGDGRGVTAASGAGVTSYYGYDTMIMVGHGPLTTWIAFLTLINSS
jgi:hypothetical protein